MQLYSVLDRANIASKNDDLDKQEKKDASGPR